MFGSSSEYNQLVLTIKSSSQRLIQISILDVYRLIKWTNRFPRYIFLLYGCLRWRIFLFLPKTSKVLLLFILYINKAFFENPILESDRNSAVARVLVGQMIDYYARTIMIVPGSGLSRNSGERTQSEKADRPY